MVEFLLLMGLVIGFNYLFWSIMGLLRFIDERITLFPIRIYRETPMTEDTRKLLLFVILITVLALTKHTIDALFGLNELEFTITGVVIWVIVLQYLGHLMRMVNPPKGPLSLEYTTVMAWIFLEVMESPEGLFVVTMDEFLLLVTAPLIITLGFKLSQYRIEKRIEYEAIPKRRIQPNEVATLTAAYNEEPRLPKMIESLLQIVPKENIFIGSDGSKDRTAEVAQSYGVNIYDKKTNDGKANTLKMTYEYFRLAERYKAVLIMDADSEVPPNYLEQALPLFDDSRISAVAVHALSKWETHTTPQKEFIFAAYRIRFYRLLQAMVRYGQTWKLMSVTPIVPGFASIYRTSILGDIEINAPGLVIEDFNMTFELHHKELGRIGYNPKAHAITADPRTWRDYYKQLRRWNLGFWQTVRRHGMWPSKFWLAMAPYLLEITLMSAFFLIAIPMLLGWFLATGFDPVQLTVFGVPITLTALGFFAGIFVLDLILTFIVALYERKLEIMMYAPLFLILRYLDAYIILTTMIEGLFKKSNTTGKWTPPREGFTTPKK